MPPKLGILAGGGPLPANLIDWCLQKERPFFVIGFEGQTDPQTVAPRADGQVPHAWVRLGAGGAALKHLRRANVRELVLIGPIKRPSSVVAMRPDLWTVRLMARAGGLGRGDDSILKALVRALESEGFRVLGIDDVVPELLAEARVYGAVQPDPRAIDDIRQGIAAAREVGARDQGQAAVVRDGRVIEVETAAGTDAMLERCAAERPALPSGVLVKVVKPGQERRVDLPTIGVGTVVGAHGAGLAGIAVEAGNALVIDRPVLVEEADKLGLFVVGVAVEPES